MFLNINVDLLRTAIHFKWVFICLWNSSEDQIRFKSFQNEEANITQTGPLFD